MMNQQAIAGTISQPIIEPMRERVINRTIMHEVPHVCPLRTKIINNHVYRHTYRPSYSCCEENTCTNIQCGSCCNFNYSLWRLFLLYFTFFMFCGIISWKWRIILVNILLRRRG